MGCCDELREDLLRFALRVDAAIKDLDENAVEDGAIEHLAQARIGLLVGLSGTGEEQERIVKGLERVVDLAYGLALPAHRLSVLLGDPFLLRLHDLDGDGVAVIELY